MTAFSSAAASARFVPGGGFHGEMPFLSVDVVDQQLLAPAGHALIDAALAKPSSGVNGARVTAPAAVSFPYCLRERSSACDEDAMQQTMKSVTKETAQATAKQMAEWLARNRLSRHAEKLLSVVGMCARPRNTTLSTPGPLTSANNFARLLGTQHQVICSF